MSGDGGQWPESNGIENFVGRRILKINDQGKKEKQEPYGVLLFFFVVYCFNSRIKKLDMLVKRWFRVFPP